MEVIIDQVKREKSGAVDGPEYTIRCFGCNRILNIIKVTRPDVDSIWNIMSECPCGEGSVSTEIRGKYFTEQGEGLIMRDARVDTNRKLITFKMENKDV